MAESKMRQLWCNSKFLAAISKGRPNGAVGVAAGADSALALSAAIVNPDPMLRSGPLPLHSRTLGAPAPASPANQPQVGDLHSITISPTKIFAGEHQQFTAMGLDYGGESQIETEVVEWSSSDASRLSFDVNKNGRAYAHRQPETGPVTAEREPVTVTATEPNSQKSGTTTVTILVRDSEMSESDRAAQEESVSRPSEADAREMEKQAREAQEKELKEQLFANAKKYGQQDGEAGKPPDFYRFLKHFKKSKGTQYFRDFNEAYERGYNEGSKKRLEKKIGPIKVNHANKGKGGFGTPEQAYHYGFTDGRSGSAKDRKLYDESPSEYEPGTNLRAYDAGFQDGQDSLPQTKDAAYKLGYADGTNDDPIHKDEIFKERSPLFESYTRGFAEGKAADSRALDKAGESIAAADAKENGKLPKVHMHVAKDLLKALGLGRSFANALVSQSKFNKLKLIWKAFKVGTEIRQDYDHVQEVKANFRQALATMVFRHGVERAGALCNSLGVQLGPFNAEGMGLAEELTDRWLARLKDSIDNELAADALEPRFQTLHDMWVHELAKDLANIWKNKRLRE